MLQMSSFQVHGHPLAGPRTQRDSVVLTCADTGLRGSSLPGEWCAGEKRAWLLPSKESGESRRGPRLSKGADQSPSAEAMTWDRNGALTGRVDKAARYLSHETAWAFLTRHVPGGQSLVLHSASADTAPC